MDREELVKAFKSTLEDFRVSRGEKDSLKKLLAESISSENERLVLRSEAFAIAKSELISPQSKEIMDWLEDVVKLLMVPQHKQKIQSEVVFSTREDCADHLQRIISSCRKSIDVCVFTVTDDRLSNALLEAHKRKVAIRIISDDEKASDAGSDIYRLRKSGIRVKTDRDPNHMHHKFALFDGVRLLNGSYNWTRSASLRNEENYVVTNEKKLVREFTSHFEWLWHNFD
ncbi:MAG: phospholipase D-like domain-containing protein [Planctomycetota bacterium]|nr:phospholipase D-like domain-containing protein [Planctomycetota bacterium]